MFPRIDIVYDMPEEQKICPHDGTALKRIGSGIHELLVIIPATVQVLNHIRYKYVREYLITATKMDETHVQVLNEPSKTAQSNSYIWVLRSTKPTAVVATQNSAG